MLTVQQLKNTGLIPTSGLTAWHQFESGASGNDISYDYSGNSRNITCATIGAPVVTANVIGGQGAWYFSGSSNPLTGTYTLPNTKHVFILASCDEAAFTTNRSLLSGVATGDILTSDSSGDNWFDLSLGANFVYRKSDVLYPNNNLNAPVGAAFALMEVQSPSGFVLDGIQIGQQRGLTARKHKGYWAFLLMYDRVLTDAERNRIKFAVNLFYSLFKQTELPLYFPSDDFMTFKRRRFYAEPPMFSKITDSFEFTDGSKTFNESGTTAPRRWEYVYKLVNTTGSTDPGEVKIFDEFNNLARMSQPFYFTDKYGTVWDNVRIENYDRDHAKHKPWIQEIKFKLIRYPN